MDKAAVKRLKNKLEGGGGSSPLFRPEEGKNIIRIIPNKFETSTNFQSLKFHYGIGNKNILCLKNFGENCPICNYVGKLFEDDSEISRKYAKQFMAKERYYTPIVVRKNGVLDGPYWLSLGYRLINILLNNFEDYGDYTDLETGRDFILRHTKKIPFPETLLSVEEQKPLSNDPKEIEKILDSLTNITEYYESFKMSEEEIKSALDSFLNGTASTEDEQEDEEVEEREDDIKAQIDKFLNKKNADE